MRYSLTYWNNCTLSWSPTECDLDAARQQVLRFTGLRLGGERTQQGRSVLRRATR